jgi:hypothetical protein
MTRRRRPKVVLQLSLLIVAALAMLSSPYPDQARAAEPVEATTKAADHIPTVIRMYPIRALLTTAPNFTGPSFTSSAPDDHHPFFGVGPEPVESINEQLLDLIQDHIGTQDQWTNSGGTLAHVRILGGTLIVKAPAEYHEQIAALLKDLAAAQARASVVVEMACFLAPVDEARKVLDPLPSPVLDAKAFRKLREAIVAKGWPQVAGFRNVSLDAQQVAVAPVENAAFRCDYEPVEEEGKASHSTFSDVNLGAVGDYAATVLPESKAIHLNLRISVSTVNIRPMPENIDLVDSLRDEFQTTLRLPIDGGTVLTGSAHALRAEPSEAQELVVLFHANVIE